MYRKAPLHTLLLCALVGIHVCAQTASSSASVMTDAELEREALSRAINATLYYTLVVHTKVEVSPMSGKFKSKKRQPDDVMEDERHTY